ALLLCFRNLRPGVTEGAAELLAGGDLRLDLLLLLRLGLEQRIDVQRVELLALHLQRVLQSVQWHFGDVASLIAGLRELQQAPAQLRATQQRQWQIDIPQRLQLRHREQALCGARVAGDEYRLVHRRTREVDPQEIRCCGGLAILVRAQHRHVEAPARELEVVRVAAELRDAVLGREHEAHVVVALVLVQPVLPALVEVHRIALQRAGLLVLLARLLARLLELGERLLARVVGALVVEAFRRRVHLRRDVLVRDEHIGDLLLAANLLLAALGEKAIVAQALVLGRMLIETAPRAMEIREDQPVRRNERGGAVRQADRREPYLVEPRGREVYAVALLHERGRRVVKRPHAFIGVCRAYYEERGKSQELELAHGGPSVRYLWHPACRARWPALCGIRSCAAAQGTNGTSAFATNRGPGASALAFE